MAFVFNKEQDIFQFLAKFLLNCDLTKNPYVDEYQDSVPDLNTISYHLDHYTNSNYDVLIIFDKMNVWLIVTSKYPTNVMNYVLEYTAEKKHLADTYDPELAEGMSA